MARGARRRQKALERKKAKRKRAAREQRRRTVALRSWPPPRAARWPLLECSVNEDWRSVGEVARVVVARRGPGGLLAMAVFAIDLECLGGKNGFATVVTPAMYREARDDVVGPARAAAIPLDLAAKIVREGIGYARSLGFSPHRDVVRAMGLLGDADPDGCADPVPVGDGRGRPLYFQGRDDDARRVLATLERAVGPDGFDFVCAGDDLDLDDRPALPGPG